MSDKNSNLVEYKVVFEESHGDFEREVNEAMREIGLDDQLEGKK